MQTYQTYKKHVHNNTCKNCNHWFSSYARTGFAPKYKPKLCPRCHTQNPLS